MPFGSEGVEQEVGLFLSEGSFRATLPPDDQSEKFIADVIRGLVARR